MGFGQGAPDLEGLAAFIRARRNQLNLTQTQLAERLIWEQKRVSNLEHGKYGLPSLPLLARLADALQVPLFAVLQALGYEDARSPSLDQAQEESAHCAALLYCLEHLLALLGTSTRTVFADAAGVSADAMGAELTAVFLEEEGYLQLVGTNGAARTEQLEGLGLDRLSLDHVGPIIQVFKTGTTYSTGEASQDHALSEAMREEFHMRSLMVAPIRIGEMPAGTLLAGSVQGDHFTQDDHTFFLAVAHWMGLFAHRAALLAASS